MTRSEKLNSALEILEFKLNKEFSSLVEIMQNKIENDKKLTDLINYKNNYSSLNKNKKNQTINSVELHHKLMRKLQIAIDGQKEVVNKLENIVNQKIQLLKKDRAQTKALEILIGRYHQQEIQAKNKNEQRELDNQMLAKLQSD